MNCLICNTEFKQKHKYHQFCSKQCKFKNYFSKERVETAKAYTPDKGWKNNTGVFDWREYPYGV